MARSNATMVMMHWGKSHNLRVAAASAVGFWCNRVLRGQAAGLVPLGLRPKYRVADWNVLYY